MAAPVWQAEPIPPQAPERHGQIEVQGGRLGYWDTGGDGPAVILLHAGTQSMAGWPYQQPVLAAAGYRAIAYSRRGYAGSDAGDEGFACDDLLALLRACGITSAHLVAAAHGGFVAFDFALEYPAAVASVAFVSSLLGITDADYAEVNARLRPKFFASLPHDFQELSPSYRAGNPAGQGAWLALVHAAVPGARIAPRLRHRLTWAALESLRCPALLLTGDSDLYTPPALLRMQAQHLDHAAFAVIAEAGHSPYWEQPAAFNEVLLGFLNRQAVPPPSR